jgi:hypothetical protein
MARFCWGVREAYAIFGARWNEQWKVEGEGWWNCEWRPNREGEVREMLLYTSKVLVITLTDAGGSARLSLSRQIADVSKELIGLRGDLEELSTL